MKSLGVIETRGLVTAIQAVDAACKSAEVACIGYRKVGAGLVSVCFEGEISAIHTAIERGVDVAGGDQHVRSLVIARPERSVVEALHSLKGQPTREAVKADVNTTVGTKADDIAPMLPEKSETAEPATPPVAHTRADAAENKNAAMKKGKKV